MKGEYVLSNFQFSFDSREDLEKKIYVYNYTRKEIILFHLK